MKNFAKNHTATFFMLTGIVCIIFGSVMLSKVYRGYHSGEKVLGGLVWINKELTAPEYATGSYVPLTKNQIVMLHNTVASAIKVFFLTKENAKLVSLAQEEVKNAPSVPLVAIGPILTKLEDREAERVSPLYDYAQDPNHMLLGFLYGVVGATLLTTGFLSRKMVKRRHVGSESSV